MEVNKIINAIETFAPPELQAGWDCSGWAVDYGQKEVKKVLLALTVSEKTVTEAIKKGCDLIISHHPLFFVPFSFQKGVSIYSAHTNLDVAKGGTTDTLVSFLGYEVSEAALDYVRIVELDKEISMEDFLDNIKSRFLLPRVRFVNNNCIQRVKKIAFCAGSGADFFSEVQSLGADVFVTGDVKFHTAFDSRIALVDIGHFESERPVLNTLKSLLEPLVEVEIADEKSPFILY